MLITIKTELTRFKVKAGKEAKVEEWLRFLNDNMHETLLTLENEKMYVEVIFKEQKAEGEFLYWFSVQGTGGQSVESSDSRIDKKHIEYWNECIDESTKPIDLDPKVVMIPDKIMNNMN
ncbi:DUF6176 family protein [Lentilactobacillus sp. Marseille-Q4993]|uniref:DUF6176 family protein n=1 Tax=Lentilactobacillus sp. Marseille-Q4993 TaxID=3039492 RepID=UPI0024BD3E3D|nr:DUF6176 family protein [Lentilactobacillus sp. Marseille-Q4993]